LLVTACDQSLGPRDRLLFIAWKGFREIEGLLDSIDGVFDNDPWFLVADGLFDSADGFLDTLIFRSAMMKQFCSVLYYQRCFKHICKKFMHKHINIKSVYIIISASSQTDNLLYRKCGDKEAIQMLRTSMYCRPSPLSLSPPTNSSSVEILSARCAKQKHGRQYCTFQVTELMI